MNHIYLVRPPPLRVAPPPPPPDERVAPPPLLKLPLDCDRIVGCDERTGSLERVLEG
ncbi:hypothetical protein D3C87_2024150 [compost metagenome]